jgi:hypothetical protein
VAWIDDKHPTNKDLSTPHGIRVAYIFLEKIDMEIHILSSNQWDTADV